VDIQGRHDGKGEAVMSRMFGLELKRIIKTKSTLIFIAAALAISCLFAVNLIQGMRLLDREFNRVYVGMDAINKVHELAKPHEGYVLPEKLVEANERYVELAEKYGGAENIPEDVYQNEIWELREFINLVGAVSNDPQTGMTIPPEKRENEDIADFYSMRREFIEEELEGKELKGDTAGQENALELNSRVDEPFFYNAYIGWGDALENITMVILLLVMICAAITAPVFSSEYQTGSDSILRCTKNGRGKLAITKILAAVLIAAAIFVMCMAAMIGIFCAAFGVEGLATSVQMMMPQSIAPLNFGETGIIVITSGLLSFVAVVCFTLFVSSRSRAPMITLIIAFVVILLPTVMRVFGNGNVMQWIRFCLPSGGIGFGNAIYYELLANVDFLRIGAASIWSPYVIVAASAICIVLFMLLTVRSYKRHEVA